MIASSDPTIKEIFFAGAHFWRGGARGMVRAARATTATDEAITSADKTMLRYIFAAIAPQPNA